MKFYSRRDIKAVTGILAASILLGGCVTTTPGSQELKSDPKAKTEIDLSKVSTTEYDKDLFDAEYRRYSIELLSQTIKNFGSEENVMVSPASVMMALDMVAAGCKGETLKQLTDLFAEGQGPLTQQAYASNMMDKINNAAEVEFSCANAVWNNANLLGDGINTEYVGYIQDTFLAEYRVTNFNNKTVDEINNWVDKHTDHMIEKVVDDLDPDTVMVLVNAIAFDGKWEEQYEEDCVREGEFISYDGTVQDATFLHDDLDYYFESDKATGFIKNYEGGEYAFLAILPKDDSISANEFMKNFTPEDYESFIDSKTGKYEVVTMMPEFTSDFGIRMNSTLIDLGAEDVFSPSVADLSGIAGVPGDIYVSRVIHKTHIEVDAKGTRAAAVTAVMAVKNAAFDEGPEIRYVECDRPFAYAIVDVETMAPVFIGTVNAI